jgi:Tfp pilus assembly protein PilO
MQRLQSNKTKFYLLLIATVLFFPLVWNLALQKTFESRSQIKELKKKLAMLEDAPQQMALVEKRLHYLEQILVSESSEQEFQSRALDEISFICKQKGLLLKAMPPIMRNLDNNYLMETLNVEIAGSFHHLVQLLYQLEDTKKNINIVSAHFFTSENKRLKHKQLVLSLYIQTLHEQNDN